MKTKNTAKCEEQKRIEELVKKAPQDLYEAMVRLLGILNEPNILEDVYGPCTEEDRLYEIAIMTANERLFELHFLVSYRIIKEFGDIKREKLDKADKELSTKK